jgi:hypothetical protein
MRFVLGISVLSTTDNVGMRPILLVLLLVAVVLILVGCCIALLTLRNQRKDKLAFITVENPDSSTKKE